MGYTIMPSDHRRSRINSVGPLVAERLWGLQIAQKVKEHTAPLVWAELVGPQVAGATEVEKVSGGVLFVSTRSAMWAQELNFYKPDILRRLNEKIGARPGEPLITDIRFANKGLKREKEGEIPKPPPLHPTRDELDDLEVTADERRVIEDGIAVVSDDFLRGKLRNARIADAKVRTWRMENGWSPCPHCGDLAPPAFPEGAPRSCSQCRVERHRGR